MIRVQLRIYCKNIEFYTSCTKYPVLYLICNFIGKFSFNSNHYYAELITLYNLKM